MEWLSPWYFAGLAAVVGPLAWHFLHRAPRGVRQFSTLMFLDPSPPRWSRTRKFQDPWLFVIRAVAIIGLALAFARPVWPAALTATPHAERQHWLLLVDTSASLQRPGLWTALLAQVRHDLANIPANEPVALWTFASSATEHVGFPTREDPAEKSHALVEAALSRLAPSWARSRLGLALTTAAERLRTAALGQRLSPRGHIVVYSDFQSGLDWTGLPGHEWPPGIDCEMRAIASEIPGNASASVVDDTTAANGQRTLRVRVANTLESRHDRFQLSWCDAAGQPMAEPPAREVAVAPGKQRLVSAPTPPAAAAGLLLTGDQQQFDQPCWVAPVPLETIRVAYCGLDADDDPTGPAYFLKRALAPAGPLVPVWSHFEDNQGIDEARPEVVVVGDHLSVAQTTTINDWLHAGTTVLLAVSEATSAQQLLAHWAQRDVQVAQAAQPSFELLAGLDFDHPLLAPFRQQQFVDFSGIRVWKHLRPTGLDREWRVFASLDRGDPLWLERTVGEGRLFWMTSTWRPEESQFARSSKFAPWIRHLLETTRRATPFPSNVIAGDPIGWPRQPATQALAHVFDPAGAEVPRSTDERPMWTPTRPGIYRARWGDVETPIAVNVAPEESRTDPLSQAAARELGWPAPSADEVAQQVDPASGRRSPLAALESRQQLWKWMLLGVLVLLVLESWIATRPRTNEVAVATSNHPAPN